MIAIQSFVTDQQKSNIQVMILKDGPMAILKYTEIQILTMQHIVAISCLIEHTVWSIPILTTVRNVRNGPQS